MLPFAPRILRGFAWAVAGLAVLILLVLAILHFNRTQEWVLARAQIVARRAGLELSADSLGYNLLRGTLELRNLTLGATGRTPSFVKARRVSVEWSYRDLRQGLNAVRNIQADGVSIDIRRGFDGRLNLPDAQASSEPIRGLPARADVRDISLHFHDGGTKLELQKLAAQLNGHDWKIDLGTPGAAEVAGTKAAIDNLRLKGQLTELTLDGVTAAGTVAMRDITIPELGNVSASSDLAFAGRTLRLDLTNLRAHSPDGSVQGNGSISFRDELGSLKAVADAKGFRAELTASWPGVDFSQFRGNARLTAARKDVRGFALVDLTPSLIKANVVSATSYGIDVRGPLEIRLPSLALNGRLTGQIPSLATTTGQQGISGSAAFTAEISGTPKSPLVVVDAESHDFAAGPMTGATLTAHAAFKNQTLRICDAVLDWQGQTARMLGDVVLAGREQTLALDVTSSGVALPRVLASLGFDYPLDGRLNLNAQIRGSLQDPTGVARIQGKDLVAWNERVGQLEAQADYANSILELTELRIDKPQDGASGTVLARGSLNLDARSFTAHLETKNLRLESLRLEEYRPMPLQVDLSGDGSGSLDDPHASLRLKVENSQTGELSAVASLTKTGIEFHAESPGLHSSEFGFPAFAKLKVDGQAAWSNWKDATAKATLADAELTVAGQRIQADGLLALQLHDQMLTVERAALKSGDAHLTIKGTLPIETASATAGLRVDGTVPLVMAERYLPPDLGLHIDGIAKVGGLITGSVLQPAPDIELATSSAAVQIDQLRDGLSEIVMRAQVKPDRVDVSSFSAAVGGGTVRGTAAIPFKTGSLTATLHLDKVDAASLYLPPERKLKSQISGSIEASSSSLALDEIIARAALTEVKITTPRSTIAQEQDVVLRLEKGRLTLDQLALSSASGSMRAAGTLDLAGERAIDLRVDGHLETEVLNRASTDYGLAGPAEAHLSVSGTLTNPQFKGVVELKDGRFLMDLPVPLAAEKVDLKAAFDGSTITIERLQGNVNGGRVTGGGSFSITGGTIDKAALKLRARSVFLEYPRGMQTGSNLDLTLASQGKTLLLGGTIAILDGAYRDAINFAGIAASKLRAVSMVTAEPNELLERLRFNVALVTRQPVVIDNNLGRVNTNADLRLIGTAQRPVITGRLEIEEGGRIYFSSRTFQVTQGVIDFTDETRIMPRFNLQADTQISNYVVTLKLGGDVDKPETSFSSEPSLNEDQILSLLFTGSTSHAGKGAAYAQTQLISLFGSSLTGGLSTKLRNTFGISEFRIDPGLVSADSDPTARLTVGQSFTPEFRITYSTNLTDSQDQIWTAEYDWRRRFLARFFRETDQSNRLELRQKLRFGGGPTAGDFSNRGARPKLRVGTVKIDGDPVFEEATILKQLELKPGKKYDFLAAQKGIARLKEYYGKHGYAEVRIQQDRDTRQGVVDLGYTIEAGLPVKFIFEGVSPSRSLQKQVARIWQQGIIDPQRINTATRAIRQHYVREGYADATAQGAIRDAGDARTVVFEVDRGTGYGRPKVTFPGAPKELLTDLKTALRSTKLDRELKSNPGAATEFLSTHLKKEGYLTVAVSAARVSVEGKSLQAEIPIAVGPKFKLGSLSFEGASSLTQDALREALIAEPGDPYVPDDRYTLAQRVQQAYWNAGFRKAEVDAEEKLDPASGRADLTMKIDEGQRFTIGDIKLQGLSVTSEKYVRKRLTLSEGDVLNAQKINDSRKNLLDSGAFNLLDFTYPAAGSPGPDTKDQPVDLVLKVREPKPFRIDFGGTYDTERKLGVIADISAVNVLGEARTLGFRTLVDSQQREYRLYFTQPFLGPYRINTTSTLYSKREKLTIFDTLTAGFTAQQFIKIRKRWDFTYGYKYEYSEADAELYRIKVSGSTSSFITSLSRDTRDNLLDATKGSFLSTALEYGPPGFGGDINYFRWYQQAFKYFGLTKPGLMPFEAERRRSHTVFATGARVGFANTLQDQQILPVDRFYAGGGTTIRGYSQNSIGPTLPDGAPIGGRATIVLNNELRFPLYKIVDGVAFLDAGNVWALPSQFSLTDLRAGAGFGLRIRNPFVIIRFDYGWKLARRPGESAGAFFFSIGQAF